MERAAGIEPAYAAWKAAILPLNYARAKTFKKPHENLRQRPLSYNIKGSGTPSRKLGRRLP